MKTITYKGLSMNTNYEEELTQEQFEQLRKQYYAKPNKADVIDEIANLVSQNGTKNSLITDYYVKDLMAKVGSYDSKWCIEDVFEYKPLLDVFYARTLTNKKVFYSDDLLTNIETAIRLGGAGICRKVGNYPIKSVDEIFKRYNVNNNYYDMSCGWGGD